jgi:hypothetical protein
MRFVVHQFDLRGEVDGAPNLFSRLIPRTPKVTFQFRPLGRTIRLDTRAGSANQDPCTDDI